MISEEGLTAAYLRHWRTVWNICYPYFLNPADTEDAVQDTFVRLADRKKPFADENHEKAWLIVTAKNLCRDELRRARRKNIPLEQAEELADAPPAEPDETLAVLCRLPEEYRTALYLYYYEEYSAADIAVLTHRRETAVRMALHRGRLMLKKELEKQGGTIL